MPYVTAAQAIELDRNSGGKLRNWWWTDGSHKDPNSVDKSRKVKDPKVFKEVFTPAMTYAFDPALRHEIMESMVKFFLDTTFWRNLTAQSPANVKHSLLYRARLNKSVKCLHQSNMYM